MKLRGARMISDDELVDLPDDPELAFVQCERKLRNRLLDSLRESEGYDIASYKLEYINHVVAIARGLNLPFFDNYNVPTVEKNIESFYTQFLQDVDHFTVQIRMRHARRSKLYSVALDRATKQKIRHYLDQIKLVVDDSRVFQRKKEALYSKINALADELDRDRTRFDAAMALVLEVSATAGEAVENLEPARKWIDSIARLLGRAKEAENTAAPRLPGPMERKRIEPPRRPAEEEKSTEMFDDLDDEIPF
jgi:hypothetical protein